MTARQGVYALALAAEGGISRDKILAASPLQTARMMSRSGPKGVRYRFGPFELGLDNSGRTSFIVGSQFVLARGLEFSCAASLTFVRWISVGE